jgi:NAD(P)-dependent dehydrogenase (short-subunit alcohol dehydrogenase family)
MEIEGAAAIVFGGASGLGAATVARLSAEGARVLVADLDADRAQATAAEHDAEAIACDVTDPTAVQAAVDRAAGLGDRGLRIMVTCAGIGTVAKLIARDGPTELDVFTRTVQVNLIGTINVLRLSAARMMESGTEAGEERGVCVCTASIAAFDGQIGQVAYAASKGGVVSITLPIARELARSGVRVMTIAPGVFETPMLAGLPEPAREALGAAIPYPSRLGRPEEYADLVVAIARNQMLNGEVIRLDGALRMAPR